MNSNGSSTSSHGQQQQQMDVHSAYTFWLAQCDSMEARNAVTDSWAYALLLVYALGVPLQLGILPTNWRLAKNRSAFLLLLYINLLNLIWLLQYIWICLEFLLLNRHWKVPLDLEAYLFRWANFCIDALYIVLAMNRSMAVLDERGRVFERLFSQKNIRVKIACIFALGIVYSLYMNWLPERRPFHCLSQLGYFESVTNIPQKFLDQLPDAGFYDGLRQVYILCIYIPLLLYIAAFAKMFHKFVQRKLTVTSSVSIAIPLNCPSPVFPPPPIDSLKKSISLVPPAAAFHDSQQQFANLALERSRLFLLCFFSQLPYLLANLLYPISRFLQIQDNHGLQQILPIVWQFFGTIFHVQEPLLMLMLSRDVRRGVREDLASLTRAFKERVFK